MSGLKPVLTWYDSQGASKNKDPYCQRCELPVGRSETMFFYDGKWMCDVCFREAVIEDMNYSLESFADTLGVAKMNFRERKQN